MLLGWLLVAGGLLLIGYSYLGYPLLVRWQARFRPRPLRPDRSWQPTVTVCLACRNEADRIASKLEQLLALDYPPAQLEFRVLDDGSTDGTAERIAPFVSAGVTLLQRTNPCGKAAALNELVGGARGEVLLLVDCRQRIDPGVLRELLAVLADPTAGAVSGELVLEDAAGPARGLGLYWRIEKALRRDEALAGSTIGVTGALYVVRRSLFPHLPAGLLLDDLAVPLAVARRGYRIGFTTAAQAVDQVADDGREFSRKLRTLGGNVQLFFRWPWLLLPGVNRLWFGYLSHKLTRLAVPYALLAILAGALLLPPCLAASLLAAGGLSGGLALLGWRWRPRGLLGRLVNLCFTFYSLNLAAFLGPWLFLLRRLSWR